MYGQVRQTVTDGSRSDSRSHLQPDRARGGADVGAVDTRHARRWQRLRPHPLWEARAAAFSPPVAIADDDAVLVSGADPLGIVRERMQRRIVAIHRSHALRPLELGREGRLAAAKILVDHRFVEEGLVVVVRTRVLRPARVRICARDDSVKVVGTHKDAIKNVFFLEDKPDVVFSAGWDLYLNAWDLRMPSRSRKILSNALPFKPHLADAKNNRVLFVSAEGKERRYDSSVILLTNAPSFERTTSRSFLNKKDFGEGQEQQQQQLGQYQHVRSCALSFNPKHSYGAQREEEEERRDSSRKQQQKQQPSCDFVLGLSNSKCSVEFFREELDEKYAYNFLCHRETVRADDAPKFAFQRQQQFQQKKNQQRKLLLHPINGCAFIQQSINLLVTGGGDGKVELWSTKTREHLETVCDFKKGSSISQLAVNDPGDLIAVAVTKNNNSSSRNTTHSSKSRKVYVKHFRPDETEETATRAAEK